MSKDFSSWHAHKTGLDSEMKRPFFLEREIWVISLGANVGSEQDGKGDQFLRPVIIIRKFNNELFWGVPLTSKVRDSQHYFIFEMKGIRRSAILSQMRPFDAKRLSYKIAFFPKEEFRALTKKLKALLP